MVESKQHLRNNNFDLLRLVAAFQVAFVHGVEHFNVDMPEALIIIVTAFPGVPIFFVISGFLISAAYERSPSLKTYAINRLLRIYPALWVCFGLGLTTVYACYQINASGTDFAVWTFLQLTIGQFYNPDFLRGYGVGTLNGSLWTIPVELQFYAALPLIYLMFEKTSLKTQNLTLIGLFFMMLLINQVNIYLIAPKDTIYSKLFGVTVLPYLYMFLIGVLIQKNFQILKPLFQNQSWKWLGLFTIWSSICLANELPFRGNSLNPISATILACLTISIAFTSVHASKWLHGNDISYGLYIYHMIIVNFFIQTSIFSNNYLALAAMLISTVLTAFVSWKLVEKPCLKLKPSSIKN